MASSSSFRFLTLFAILALGSVARAADTSIIDYDNKHGTCPAGARKGAEMQMMYEKWLARRAYKALGEKEKRFEIFKDTVRFVDEHNSVDRTRGECTAYSTYAHDNPQSIKPEPSTVCDEGHSCPEGTTCCCAYMWTSIKYPDRCLGWTCCPYQSATCCDDWETCCPQDYPVCDTDAGTCLMSKNNPLGIRALRRDSAIETPVLTVREDKQWVERLMRTWPVEDPNP